MIVKISPQQDWIAIETGPGVTAGKYFVYSPDNGGHYSDGNAEKIDTWADVDLPEPVPAEQPQGTEPKAPE